MSFTSTRPAPGKPIPASWGDEVSDSGLLGEQTGNTAVVVATLATSYASSIAVTFTLATQRRVEIRGIARSNLGTTANSRFSLNAAYNSGSTAVIGSAITCGQVNTLYNASAIAGGNGAMSGWVEGTVLLPAGTYTAYLQLQRATGGSATDSFNAFGVKVYDVGAT